jgi:DNA-binding GntR family transcriptional regulator
VKRRVSRPSLDQIEARLRATGVPDVEEWRRRVEALHAAYEGIPRHRRAWWWVRGWIDSIRDRAHSWRRSYRLNASAHAEFIAHHPDYAAALARGDEQSARLLLARIVAEKKSAMMATPAYRQFLASRLREQGFSEADVAAADAMLDNIDHDKRKN